MARFRIDFGNGRVEELEQSDCATVEQYVNCRFGRGAKPKAKVTLVGPRAYRAGHGK